MNNSSRHGSCAFPPLQYAKTLQEQQDQTGSCVKRYQVDIKNLTSEVPKKEGDATKAKRLADDKAKQVEKLRVEAKAEEQRAADLEKQAQEAR